MLLGREDALSREGPEKMVVLPSKTLLGREDTVSREGPEKMVVTPPKTVLKTVPGRWSAVVSLPEAFSN
jgi:hypothetical protein